MAIQTLNSSEVSNAQVAELSKVYELFQNKTDFWSWTTKMPSDQINALGIKVPIEITPNPSFAYGTGNNDAFATAQASNFDNFTVTYAYVNAGTIETYAGFLNRNANTSEDMVRYQEASSARQFASFLNRYASRGNGTAGLATTNHAYDAGNPTLVTCDAATDSIGCSQLVVGAYYTFWDATGTTQRTGTVGAGEIQLVSKTGTVATFASNVPSTLADTDIIVPQLGGSTDASTAIVGLPYIDNSTGTYFGKTRTSAGYTGLASFNKSSSSITAGVLSETYWSIVQRGGWFTGDGTTNLEQALWMVLNTGNMQSYYSLSLNSGAVVSSPNFFMHGADSPKNDIGMASFQSTWFGAPMKVGNDIRGDEIYFLGKDSLRRAILKDVGDVSAGFPASDYLQNIDGSGNFLTARIKIKDFLGQLYCPQPFKIGKISGLTLVAPLQKTVMVA